MTVKEFMSIHTLRSLKNITISLFDVNKMRSLFIDKYSIEDPKWNSYVDEWYKKEVVEVTYSQSFYKDIVVTVECR